MTITAMYIMLVTSLDDEQALAIVKQCRPQAGPNFGFRTQLQKYYKNYAEQVCVAVGMVCAHVCLHVVLYSSRRCACVIACMAYELSTSIMALFI